MDNTRLEIETDEKRGGDEGSGWCGAVVVALMAAELIMLRATCC